MGSRTPFVVWPNFWINLVSCVLAGSIVVFKPLARKVSSVLHGVDHVEDIHLYFSPSTLSLFLVFLTWKNLSLYPCVVLSLDLFL
jgi:hypothetical protein